MDQEAGPLMLPRPPSRAWTPPYWSPTPPSSSCSRSSRSHSRPRNVRITLKNFLCRISLSLVPSFTRVYIDSTTDIDSELYDGIETSKVIIKENSFVICRSSWTIKLLDTDPHPYLIAPKTVFICLGFSPNSDSVFDVWFLCFLRTKSFIYFLALFVDLWTLV